MDEARCRATSQLLNGCVAHCSHRLLTRHLKTCSLVTLFTTFFVASDQEISPQSKIVSCLCFMRMPTSCTTFLCSHRKVSEYGKPSHTRLPKTKACHERRNCPGQHRALQRPRMWPQSDAKRSVAIPARPLHNAPDEARVQTRLCRG